MNNSTLLTIGISGVVAMLSAGLIAVPTTIQQASAQTLFEDTENEIENDVDNKIDQENKCNSPSTCTNTGTTTSDDDFQIKQMNKCSTNIKVDDSSMLDKEGTSRSSATAPNGYKASSATVIDLGGTGIECNTNADILDTEDD
jgi:hypothetical protein